jgi:hypothetical protein
MTIPDWTDLTFYHYLAIGGGAVVLIALILYFTPIARLKVPAVIIGIIGGFGAGAALGVLGMASFGYRLDSRMEDNTASNTPPPGMGPMMMGGGMRMGGGGGGRAMMGGGGRGPNPKTQLATLVTKLDQLSGKPLSLSLSTEQKQKVRDQLQKLEDGEELKEDDAKQRLDSLLVVLQDQRKTLEAAGYRWPGAGQGGGQGGGGRAQANEPNPFRDDENSHHLKSLRAYLTDKKTE